MSIVRKIDGYGRVVIPRDMRGILNWGDGDNIEATLDAESQTIILRKYENNSTKELKKLSESWEDDPEVKKHFDDLISLIENKS